MVGDSVCVMAVPAAGYSTSCRRNSSEVEPGDDCAEGQARRALDGPRVALASSNAGGEWLEQIVMDPIRPHASPAFLLRRGSQSESVPVGARCGSLRPDLHMPDETKFEPDFIRSQLLCSAKHIVIISVWDDEKSHALANSYGAVSFLDKNTLSSTLIPAILNLC
jgi:hypothetical protein